ncbi:MAG TPA: carboxypeptidase-like regulatory domain-containing protein [Candidatus Acidoferrales bacterium]|nr:carboxypeptidase-like regulatory domain-containing protein [Candidatus Acidoferrales bacterium]
MIATHKAARTRSILFASFLICASLVPLRAQYAPAQNPSAPNVAGSATQSQNFASVSGTVVSASTGQPLRKARVELSSIGDRNQNPPLGTTTDASGQFEIDGITPGRYDLSASRRGYVSKRYQQENADSPGAELTLSAGQTLKAITFRLEQTAVIDGHVYDEDGDPLQGAAVQILRRAYMNGKRTMTTVNEVMTDDRGAYRMFGIEPGHYYVMASWGMGRMFADPGNRGEPTYAPVFYPNADSAERAAPIDLKPGDELPGMDFQLAPSNTRTYEVSGRATSASGANGIFVTLTSKNPQAQFMTGFARREATMDANGAFRFTGVAPGEYVISATTGLRRLGEASGPPQSANREISVVDSNVTGVSLVLSAGASIVGHVAFEGDAGSANGTLMVNLSREDQTALGNRGGPVGSDGTFTIAGVPDGQYTLNVYSRCGACFVKAVTSNGADLFGKPIDVEGGAGPSPLEIVYSSNTADVNGTVATSDNQPGIGALVVVIPNADAPDRERRYRTATTDQYGRFDVKGVPPGEYTIIALQGMSDDQSFLDPDFMQQYANKAETLNLTEGDHKTLQLNLVSVNTQ